MGADNSQTADAFLGIRFGDRVVDPVCNAEMAQDGVNVGLQGRDTPSEGLYFRDDER